MPEFIGYRRRKWYVRHLHAKAGTTRGTTKMRSLLPKFLVKLKILLKEGGDDSDGDD